MRAEAERATNEPTRAHNSIAAGVRAGVPWCSVSLYIKGPCRPGCLSSHHVHSATSYTERQPQTCLQETAERQKEKKGSSQTLPISSAYLPLSLSEFISLQVKWSGVQMSRIVMMIIICIY